MGKDLNLEEAKAALHNANLDIALWVSEDSKPDGPGLLNGEAYTRLQSLANSINKGIDFIEHMEQVLSEVRQITKRWKV